MKPPVGSFPDPTTGQDAVTRAHAEANFAPIGALVSAQGDFVYATMSADDAQATPSKITFDTTPEIYGDITLVSNEFSLKAGRRYQLLASLQIEHAAPGSCNYQWYDATGATLIGQEQEILSTTATGINRSTQSVAAYQFAPTVDTLVHVRRVGGTTNANINAERSWVMITEIGAVQADVVGGLEPMDIIEVVSPVASVTFGEGGDGLLGRALDGDVDEVYELHYHWPKPNLTAQNLEIHPNGVDIGASSSFDRHVSSGTADNGSGWVFCRIGTAGAGTSVQANGHAIIFAKTGKQRALTGSYSANAVGGTSLIGAEMYAGWHDDSTNITSLKIINEADNLPAGTRLVLYRRTSANLRADSAAVYERHAMEMVDPGALATTERTVGHTIYGGSIVGVSARVEDAVTAGSITVNVKVDGTTMLSVVLDTTNPTSNVVREVVGFHKFAADKNVSVEFVPTSYDNAGSLASAVTVQVHLTNDALITQNDRVVARDELSADGGTITVTGLNGDLDEEYEVVGRIKMAILTSFDITWLPNLLPTNMSVRRTEDAAAPITDTLGTFISIPNVSTAAELNFRARFFAKRGDNRRGMEIAAGVVYDGSTLLLCNAFGMLLNETANIASLAIKSSTGGAFASGSWVEVRRIKA